MPERPAESPLTRTERTCVLGARVGFTIGLSAISAEVIAGLAPAGVRPVVYALWGATAGLGLWRATGRMFGRLERLL